MNIRVKRWRDYLPSREKIPTSGPAGRLGSHLDILEARCRRPMASQQALCGPSYVGTTRCTIASGALPMPGERDGGRYHPHDASRFGP
jgi:hypothetical protein